MESVIGKMLRWRRAGGKRLSCALAGGPATMRLSSPSFGDGGPIPRSLTAWEGDHFPTLSWTGVPAGASELALIIEDIDAPTFTPFVHGVLTGISPAVSGLTESSLGEGARIGYNSYGKLAYRGPRALKGHGVHRYVFQIFALDIALPPEPFRKKDLLKLIRGHVLARGELTGTFES